MKTEDGICLGGCIIGKRNFNSTSIDVVMSWNKACTDWIEVWVVVTVSCVRSGKDCINCWNCIVRYMVVSIDDCTSVMD